MNSRFFIHITLLFAAVTFWACSSEDDVSVLGGQPLVLYADMPMTRSTVDNQWNVGDEIAVKIGDEIKKYYIKDAETGELTTFGTSDPFRWSPNFDSVEVTAWSLGGSSNADPLTGITIPEDQSGGYDSYDLLYAKGTMTPSNTHLTFYHQMAKVVVQLKFNNSESGIQPPDVYLGLGYDIAPDGEWIQQEIIPLKADFTAPISENKWGTWSNYSSYPNYGITMKQEGEDKVESGYDVAYSALLIPNDYSGKRFVFVNEVSDMGIGYIPKEGEADLAPGTTTTFKITVCDDSLDVVVVNDGNNNSVTPWAAP